MVRQIEADSDEIRAAWTASPDWIYSLAANPDGQSIATGDWLGAIQLWSADGRLIRRWAND